MEEHAAYPYILPLLPASQSHPWGKKGVNSLVASLISQNSFIAIHPEERYAELTVGTHASMPARIAYDQSRTLLDFVRNEVIEVDSAKLEHYRRLHKNGLPFQLKVLSVDSPQPVHLHPDNVESQNLHKSKPHEYPDDIGKAEMTYALSPVEALFGFRSANDILADLVRVPEFAEAVGRVSTDNFARVAKSGRAGSAQLRMLFSPFMSKQDDKATECLKKATKRLKKMPKSYVTPRDELLLDLSERFPADPMCFSAYFLTHVKLDPGSAVFIHPNEPHSYLKGDILEISTLSMNIACAGLTDERIDRKTFSDLLTYDDSPPDISKGAQIDDKTVLFSPPVDEFQLTKYEVPCGERHDLRSALSPSVIVVLGGEGFISVNNDEVQHVLPLSTGIVFYLKASTSFTVSSSKTRYSEDFRSPLTIFQVSVNETVSPGSSCSIA